MSEHTDTKKLTQLLQAFLDKNDIQLSVTRTQITTTSEGILVMIPPTIIVIPKEADKPKEK